MTSFILCLFAKGFINVIMRQGLWLQNGYDKLMQPPTNLKFSAPIFISSNRLLNGKRILKAVP